ncbi:recombinase family protein [Saccharopolyspora sp. K220]|uniref:recombinase family protein n=1 Tax=Saccharopolyspora soli TaxID=2926618 RepID=UPI001F5650B0|nr:recombinase family protein [Saccharopolyspora soli]MCI2421132.1 recombinase family protein [Saccharopolyspora soli]
MTRKETTLSHDITDNPWATLDALIGIEVVDLPDSTGIGQLAFYGRCSTEDNQDPETSRGWQSGNARKFIEPLGGTIAAEYFDVGQSRSVPWPRRPQANQLLAALKDPDRGWNAIVVGEGTRCWFGNQFSLIAPRIAAYGVGLWIPELGGEFDPRNPSHSMLMSVLGGMSESERQHAQARVRAAMDAQVLNEGRHQGGRAPYGYVVVDGGPHPNPRKATEGYRLRVLAIDEPSAEAVRRIFAEYLDGCGDRAIANGLNRDAIPCPSARRPDQNRHRRADGWHPSTVRFILENPRYTGYAFFGRWIRYEALLDPDDVAAGYVTRFRRADPSRIVRSRRPAHPEIITVDDFTQAQLLRRSKGSRGLPAMSRLERTGRSTKRSYLFHGRIRCAVCSRKMHADIRDQRVYYRCMQRTLPPHSPVASAHPRSVYLREDRVRDAVTTWISTLRHPHHARTALAAGAGATHEAVPDLATASPTTTAPAGTDEAINALITSLNPDTAASAAKPTTVAAIYRSADLRLVFDPTTDAATVTLRLPKQETVCLSGRLTGLRD